ncbi:hypothetical protein WR25_03153 [Diploscapter pachys]|uniref:DNA2/NAM7 helicase-like C-terminal domain-containing protein n=1 Tax=Diploscapter pachys TaxID=2018661 RepID=A0A2A2L724_9BILA|nr:hypothetical protein WR25_03153 [Diploscapter pachys]
MVENRASHLSLHEMVAKSAGPELRSLLDLKSKRNLKPKEAAKLRALELCAQLRILRASRIAVTTCSSAAMECIKEIAPTHLLLDEAGMCSIPEALVPLMSGVKRFVMIGDVQQLPPLILSSRAHRCGLAISVMERAIAPRFPANSQGKECSVEGAGTQSFFWTEGINVRGNAVIANRVPGVVLKPQHRMHPSISAFSNSEFYEDELVDAVDVEELEGVTAKWNWRPGQRKAFLECREPEARCGDSFINVTQAVQIVDLAEEFIDIGIKPEDVGIITFYRAQTEFVQHIIRKGNHSDGGKLKGLEAKNVDGFQSQEKQVILLSTVRANEKGNCGFLKDFRRVNVALTRAKSGLLIIGSSETLATDKVLNSMLRHYQSNGTIYGGCVGHLRSIEIDIGEPKEEDADAETDDKEDEFERCFELDIASDSPNIFKCKVCDISVSGVALSHEHLNDLQKVLKQGTIHSPHTSPVRQSSSDWITGKNSLKTHYQRDSQVFGWIFGIPILEFKKECDDSSQKYLDRAWVCFERILKKYPTSVLQMWDEIRPEIEYDGIEDNDDYDTPPNDGPASSNCLHAKQGSTFAIAPPYSNSLPNTLPLEIPTPKSPTTKQPTTTTTRTTQTTRTVHRTTSRPTPPPSSHNAFDCNKLRDPQDRHHCQKLKKWDKEARKIKKVKKPRHPPGISQMIAYQRPDLALIESQLHVCMTFACVCEHLEDVVVRDGQCFMYNKTRIEKAIRVVNIISSYDITLGLTGLVLLMLLGPAYLLFHREYLKRFELALRSYNFGTALPYIDWTLDDALDNPEDSILFSEHLLGETPADGGFIMNGRLKGWGTLEVAQ